MAIEFGSGPKLKQAFPWLQDDKVRHELILDVAERNSVIEGLPPFDDEMRQQFKDDLANLAAKQKSTAE
jgi:hypothetical protein